MRWIAAFLLSLVFISCQKENTTPPVPVPVSDYRDTFVGHYEGKGMSYSAIFNDYSETQHSVQAQVEFGEMDSTINILLIYDGQDSSEIRDWKIPEDGISSETAGGGSSYRSLSIVFTTDSMEYDYFGKCGIPCSSGTYFKIKKTALD